MTCACGQPAKYLCDYPLDGLAAETAAAARDGKPPRTCDRPLCAACRRVQSSGIVCSHGRKTGHGSSCQPFSVDHCEEHAELARLGVHHMPAGISPEAPAASTGPKWTPQQEAVYAAIADNRSGHLLVEAVAGSGKTTISVEAARRTPKGSRTGFVAFNRHIAAELQGRLGNAASAQTLHALGFAACRKASRDVKLDEGKVLRHLLSLRPKWFWKGSNDVMRPGDEAQAVAGLARLAKGSLADYDRGGPAAFAALVQHHGLDLTDDPGELIDATAELLERCAADTATVDFDDMVWLPVVKGWPVAGYDLLIVDEAQDLNRCQQVLARAACPGGRLVLVGDRDQSLYGFSGADPEAIPRLAKLLGESSLGLLERPLTVTFRCPTSHVALARQVVPRIEAAEGAREGDVSVVPPEKIAGMLEPGDLIVCRLNGPLVDLAYQLIAAGRPALMRGRDIGKGLVSLIDRLRPDSCEDLGKKLTAWGEKECSRLERRGASQSSILAIEDKVECLSRLASQSATVDQLRRFIASLFTDDGQRDDQGKILLSSIHRAKGLEAGRIVIIAPEKLPLVRKDQQPWEAQQERCALYVALTRARETLIFAGGLPASITLP